MRIEAALIVFAAAAAGSWAATGALLPFLRGVALDVPNARSSHKTPTARGGGLGIVVGVAVGAIMAKVMSFPVAPVAVLAGAAVMGALGWLDDRKNLRASTRFLAQLVVASIVTAILGPFSTLPLPAPLDLGLMKVVAFPLSVIWIVGVTNVYNFLDGIDGFAGAQGLVASLAFVWIPQGFATTGLALALAGACAGFLRYNWHPARVFMGDVGSMAIGFTLATLPLAAPAPAKPLVVFAMAMFLWFFLADGAFTILSRLFRGERVWQAHRSHLYQRLVIAGSPHDRVVVAVAGAAVIVAGVTLLCMRARPIWCWTPLFLATACFVAYREFARLAEARAERHAQGRTSR